MSRLKNIHPGEILKEEFLNELNMSAYRLAKDTAVPQTRISEIIKGNRRITADTAIRLSKYFGNTPKFWPGLQDDYDLEEELLAKGEELNGIKHFNASAAWSNIQNIPGKFISYLPQHLLYCLPLPQGHGALRLVNFERKRAGLPLVLKVASTSGSAIAAYSLSGIRPFKSEIFSLSSKPAYALFRASFCMFFIPGGFTRGYWYLRFRLFECSSLYFYCAKIWITPGSFWFTCATVCTLFDKPVSLRIDSYGILFAFFICSSSALTRLLNAAMGLSLAKVCWTWLHNGQPKRIILISLPPVTSSVASESVNCIISSPQLLHISILFIFVQQS